MFFPSGRSNRSGSSPLRSTAHNQPQSQTSRMRVAARNSPDKFGRATSRQCAVRTLSENRIGAKSPMTCSSTITELNRANQDLRTDLSRCLAAVREARSYSERMEDIVVAFPDYITAFKAGMMELSLLQHALFLENSFVLLQGWEVQQIEERERCEVEIASICEDYSARLEQSEAEQRDTLDEVQRRWQAVVGSLREENDELSQNIEVLEREKESEKQRADAAEAALARREKEAEEAAAEKRASLVSVGIQVQPEESSSRWDGSSRSESLLHTARVALPGQRAFPEPTLMGYQTRQIPSLSLSEHLAVSTSFGPQQIDGPVTMQEPWTLREHGSHVMCTAPALSSAPSEGSSHSNSALHTERVALPGQRAFPESSLLRYQTGLLPSLPLSEQVGASASCGPHRVDNPEMVQEPWTLREHGSLVTRTLPSLAFPSEASSRSHSALHTERVALPGQRTTLHPSSRIIENHSEFLPSLQLAGLSRVSASSGPQHIDNPLTVQEPWTLRESTSWQVHERVPTRTTGTAHDSPRPMSSETASTRESYYSNAASRGHGVHTIRESESETEPEPEPEPAAVHHARLEASIVRSIAARFDAWMLLKQSFTDVHRALVSEAYDDAARLLHRRRLMAVYEKSVSAVITGTTIADSARKSASKLSSQRKQAWDRTTRVRSAPHSPSPQKPSHVIRELSVAFDDEAREEAVEKKQKKPLVPRRRTPTSSQKEGKSVKTPGRSVEKSHLETPTSASVKRRVVVSPVSSKKEPTKVVRVVHVSTPPSQQAVQRCRTSERKSLLSAKDAEEAINEIRALRLELERLQETHRSARVELLASDTTSKTLSATVLQLTDELRFLRSALDVIEHAAAEENATDANAGTSSSSASASAPTALEFLALDGGAAELPKQQVASAAALRADPVHLDALLAAASSAATTASTAAVNRQNFETLAPMLVEFIRANARDVCNKEAVTQLPPPQPLASPPSGWKELYILPWDAANSASSRKRPPDLDDWAVACERASQWCALFLVACASLYHLHASVEEKYITMEKQQWDKRVVRKVVGDIRTSVGRLCTEVAQADWAEYKQRFPAFFRSVSSPGGGGVGGAIQPQQRRRSNSRIASSLFRPNNETSAIGSINFSSTSRLSAQRTMSGTRRSPFGNVSHCDHAR